MDNFKFNFLSRGQLESLSLDKFLLSGFKTKIPRGFSGNLIFAIIARMLCGNHLNILGLMAIITKKLFYTLINMCHVPCDRDILSQVA